jgi:hypothetical protein
MPSVGFETAILAIQRLQTYTLGDMAIGIGTFQYDTHIAAKQLTYLLHGAKSFLRT